MRPRYIVFLLLFSLLFFKKTASAQYADLGAGALKNTIWWINWSGFSLSNGASKTFTTDDGLTVTITFSNISGPVLQPNVMNTWSGAILHLLYDFSNTSIQPALFYTDNYPGGVPFTIKFSMKITATRNGVPTPFTFVGADAEASLLAQEVSTLTTDGSVWGALDFYRNSPQTTDPMQGCGTNTVMIDDTQNPDGTPQNGQNPVVATDASATGILNVNVTMDEKTPTGGGMALAFGIFSSIDRGDLPASFGTAQHKLVYQKNNSCNYVAPLPSLTQSQALKLGSIAPDADPIQYSDDNAYNLADEDAITSFPKYDGSGTYSLTVPLANTTGANTYLTGWFDKNRNGSFDIGESTTATVANNSTSAVLKWTGLPLALPGSSTDSFGFRFRLSSALTATQSATGFAPDGEVEDYYAHIVPLCATTYNTIDTTICNSKSYLGHSTSGTYIDTLMNIAGCDSIRTLHLAVVDCNPLPCSLVKNLILNTGYNPRTNSLIPVGQEDSNWTVSAVSPAMLGVPGEVAIGSGTSVITPNPNWVTNANSNYISSVNNGTNGYNTTYNGLYTMTATRTFVTTVSDVFLFNLNFAGDNFISSLLIDGVSVLPPRSIVYTDFAAFQSFSSVYSLAPGVHTISITLLNRTDDQAYTNNNNYFGLNVFGTVSSTSNLNSIAGPNTYSTCCVPTARTIDTTICMGNSYLGHTTTGTYIDTITNLAGCDSVRTVHLTVITCPCTTTNSLIINTGYDPLKQSAIPIGQRDSNWIVTAMSSAMQSDVLNVCNPVPQPAMTIQDMASPTIPLPPANTQYISCLSSESHTTTGPAAYTMTVQRSFTTYISDIININMNIGVDNVVTQLTIDGVPQTFNNNPYGVFTFINCNYTIPLNAGKHTISITAQDLSVTPDNPNGNTTPNGFDLIVQGSVSSTTSINSLAAPASVAGCCIPTAGTIDTTIYQGQYYLGHTLTGTYIDTIQNIAGCDSIRTVNLIVNNPCATTSCPLVNNIIINTGYDPATKTSIAPGQKDINWIVTGMSDVMQNAICYGNTNSPQAPPTNTPTVPPVLLNQNADVVSTGAISCFPYNTIYTLQPPALPAGGIFNYTMNIRKQFYICSNQTEPVTFNFTTTCDDAIDSVIVDAGTPNAITWLSVMTKTVGSGTPITINKTINLSPGTHTLDIQCANWEDPNSPNYYPITVNGQQKQYQWNPFGVNVTGTITSVNNVLLNNTVCCTPTSGSIDTSICQGESYLGHSTTGSYIDTIKNVAGCDSIRTLNLTVTNCTPQFCTGTLGAPIVNITFGSGSTNPGLPLSAVIPGTSTSYNYATYATGTPPASINDGDYALINEVPHNDGWFTGAKDHTGNANGYMAFFNAAPTPGVFYTQTVTALCPGTTYEFAAWVANVVNPALLPNSATPNITFNILNPNTQAVLGTFTTGNIPTSSSMTWKQYGFLFTMPVGLNSVTLVLTNNNAGGASNIGNDLAIDDITFRPCGPTTTAAISLSSICQTDSVSLTGTVSGGLHNPAYQWQISIDSGKTFTDIAGATTLIYKEQALPPGAYQFQLLSAEASNINASTCRFVSNAVLLTVSNCASLCKSSFDFIRASNSIVNLTARPPAALSQLYNANGFTWEGFVQLKAPITNQSLIISTEDSVPYQDIFLGFGFGATPNALSFMISDNGTNNATVATESVQNLTVNTWYHVAAVCDYANAQLLLYLNGNLVSTTTIPANILSNRLSANHLMQIGNASETLNGIDANIDEVRFWNTVRTQAQIQSSMNDCLTLPATGLIAYFKADEANGTKTYSTVDNNFTGTLNNTGWALPAPVAYCDSISIAYDSTSCNSFNFKGSSSTTGSTATWKWVWYFDDGTTAAAQNTSHSFAVSGNHTIKLVATDGNGCSDSTSIMVTSSILFANAGNDSLICKNNPIHLQGSGAGTPVVQYAWSPKAYLNDSTLQNPTATINTSTSFYLTIKNAYGCISKDTVTISVQNVLVKTNNDTAICAGSSVQLNTTGGATYSWLPVTGLSNPGIDKPLATPANTTQYIVTGISTIGCPANDTVTITVNQLPIVKTNNDTAICINTSVQLNTTGASTYLWTAGIGLSNTNSGGSALASPTTTTKYFVTGTDLNNCSAKDSVIITVNALPVIVKSNDTSICRNTSVQLSVSGGVNYQWQATSTLNNLVTATPVATPVNAETYHVSVTGSNSCVNTASITVGIRPLPFFTVSPDQGVCISTPVQLSAGGGDQYLWSPASAVNNASIANPLTSTITATTTYSVLISESTCKNDTTLTTTVTLLPPLDISIIKSNDLDCSNGSAQLMASGASWYRWSPAIGLNDTTIADPIVSSLSTIKYTVRGSNAQGCEGLDTIIVYANYADKNSGYYMPNAFTPNGDGVNDCFGIKYWGLIEKIDFSIYNRWGERVFYTNTISSCWDGTQKGLPADAGAYIYIIKASTACGQVQRQGTVILIR